MYKYVRVGDEIQNIAIPTDEQINILVVCKIREKYSVDDEFKMNRLERVSIEWKAYDNYVSECVGWGKIQKELALSENSIWENNQWDESVESRNEFIDKIKALIEENK